MTSRTLRVGDVPWNLASANAVIIGADSADLSKGDLVRLWRRDRSALATIHSVEDTETNAIKMDKGLRDMLGVRIGEVIQIRIEKVIGPMDAESVEVHVEGPEFDESKVKELLMNSLIWEGARIRRSTKEFPEGVEMEVRKTRPDGVVRVVQSTNARVGYRGQETVLKPGGGGLMTEARRPTESFDEIGGVEDVKQVLRENIVYAIEKKDVYRKFGYHPFKGIMLHGPPGTGKTVLAKATANEARANFIEVPSSQLMDKFVGETERNMREIFSKAKEMAPCIIFFDEIDAVAYARSDWKVNFVNQLLTLMDDIRNLDIFVIGATNRLELIDQALLRPGRFAPVEVPPPDNVAREKIFRIHLKDTPTGSLDFGALASETEGFTGAQIWGVCRNAKGSALREANYSPHGEVRMEHLRAEIRKIRPAAERLPYYG